MKRAGLAAALAAGLALTIPALVQAAELDRGDLRLELTGELRGLYTFSRELDRDDFLESLPALATRRDSWRGLVRARAQLESVWQDRLYGQLVYDA